MADGDGPQHFFLHFFIFMNDKIAGIHDAASTGN